MTLETKYRDFPAAELRKIHADMPHGDPDVWERTMRGKPVVILTPPIPEANIIYPCGSPWYTVVVADGEKHRIACCHLLEIGD